MVDEQTIEAIDEARLIVESLDPSGAMTIGFEENETYNLTGKQLAEIAKALYLADCLINDLQNKEI